MNFDVNENMAVELELKMNGNDTRLSEMYP